MASRRTSPLGRWSHVEHLEPRTLLDSSLSPPVIFQSEQSVRTVAAGDFDGDGHRDLAIASNGPDKKRLAFLKGNGDGTFESPRFSGYAHHISHLAAADFNGDGRDELVLAGLAANSARSRLARLEFNNEVQKLRVTTSRPVPGFVQDIAILTSASGPSHVLYLVRSQWLSGDAAVHSIMFSNPALPIVATPVESTQAEWRGFRIADVNADGRSDLIVTLMVSQPSNSTVLVYHQSTDSMASGTFEDPTSLVVPGLTGGPALLFDVDLDGELDIVTAPGAVLLFRGDGNGGFLAHEVLFEGPSQGSNSFRDLGFQTGPTGEPELQVVHTHFRAPVNGYQSLLRFIPQGDGTFVIREGSRRRYFGEDRYLMVHLTDDARADVIWLSNRSSLQEGDVLLFVFDGLPRPPVVRDVAVRLARRPVTSGQEVAFRAKRDDPERLMGEPGGIRSLHFFLDTNHNGVIDAGDVLAATRQGRVTVGAHWPRGTFTILAQAIDETGLMSEIACSKRPLMIV